MKNMFKKRTIASGIAGVAMAAALLSTSAVPANAAGQGNGASCNDWKACMWYNAGWVNTNDDYNYNARTYLKNDEYDSLIVGYGDYVTIFRNGQCGGWESVYFGPGQNYRDLTNLTVGIQAGYNWHDEVSSHCQGIL